MRHFSQCAICRGSGQQAGRPEGTNCPACKGYGCFIEATERKEPRMKTPKCDHDGVEVEA